MAHSERMGRSPKTLHEYRRKIDKSIRPTLGAIALDKLSVRNRAVRRSTERLGALAFRSY
jgi:hypothetical protein